MIGLSVKEAMIEVVKGKHKTVYIFKIYIMFVLNKGCTLYKPYLKKKLSRLFGFLFLKIVLENNI